MKEMILNPIPRQEEDYEKLEKRFKFYFRKYLYNPILLELKLPNKRILKNAASSNPLIDGLFTGKITYNKGTFSGKFNARISKELRSLGAQFDRKSGTYRLSQDLLPLSVKNVISAGDAHFQKTIDKITDRLEKIIPEEFAIHFKCQDLFDRMIWKADTAFQKNVKNIAVAPQLTDSQRTRIAAEWQNNMELWIQDFTSKEIITLRKQIQDSVFRGDRWGSVVETIQESYQVSAKKAKFLARQETHLLIAKMNKTQYTDSGISEYIWRCVHRPHDASPKVHIPGNVRYYHGILDGTRQRWDNPPKTDAQGNRNNPGEDFNCRCVSRPVVKFKV